MIIYGDGHFVQMKITRPELFAHIDIMVSSAFPFSCTQARARARVIDKKHFLRNVSSFIKYECQTITQKSNNLPMISS